MRVIKFLLIRLLGIIVVVLALAATRPATFRIERSATISASADSIFPLINDFARWREWSPWEELDPTMTRELSGASSGEGAVYTWAGNNQVGEGRMEITESAPPSRVAIVLDFLKPFESHNLTEFQLRQVGESTVVTWTMSGENNFMGKLMGLFMDMDTLIGADFEKGLTKLGSAVRG